MDRETRLVEYTEASEVSAQVYAWTVLLGHMGSDSCPPKEFFYGVSCIGAMISQNVEAMIADFEDQLRQKAA